MPICAREGCNNTFEPRQRGGQRKRFCSQKCVQAAWYSANREKVKSYAADWCTKNSERMKTTKAAYYQKNRDRIKIRDARYCAANRDTRLAKQAAWYRANREKIKERHNANKEADNAKIRVRRASRRDRIYDELAKICGPACVDCGGVFPPCVYDYHHTDPTKKDKTFNLSAWPWSRIKEYVSHTVQLCANCHRIRHFVKRRGENRWTISE